MSSYLPRARRHRPGRRASASSCRRRPPPAAASGCPAELDVNALRPRRQRHHVARHELHACCCGEPDGRGRRQSRPRGPASGRTAGLPGRRNATERRNPPLRRLGLRAPRPTISADAVGVLGGARLRQKSAIERGLAPTRASPGPSGPDLADEASTIVRRPVRRRPRDRAGERPFADLPVVDRLGVMLDRDRAQDCRKRRAAIGRCRTFAGSPGHAGEPQLAGRMIPIGARPSRAAPPAPSRRAPLELGTPVLGERPLVGKVGDVAAVDPGDRKAGRRAGGRRSPSPPSPRPRPRSAERAGGRVVGRRRPARSPARTRATPCGPGRSRHVHVEVAGGQKLLSSAPPRGRPRRRPPPAEAFPRPPCGHQKSTASTPG